MNNIPFAPYLVAGVFALAVGATRGGAIIAVVTTRLIRAVSGLMLSCLGLAGLYYFLNSPFLALMEILIYVGAVCVTIVFAIMLAEPDEPRARDSRGWLWTGATLAISGGIGVLLSRLSLQGPWPSQPAQLASDGSVAAIGRALLTTYSLAFEVISLLLLLAILGALVVARSGRKATSGQGGTISVSSAPRPARSPALQNAEKPEKVVELVP